MPTMLAVALQSWGTRRPRGWLAPQGDRTGAALDLCSVLVVDDDFGVRQLTARMLRAQGYKVMEAGSGAEALRMLESDPEIRLLLTDIIMPGMDGLILADRALGKIPHLRIVLMTGHAPELTAQLESREVPLPVLLKPFTAAQLLGKVRGTLDDAGH